MKRQSSERPKRASGRSFASVVTRIRWSLNRVRNEPNSRLQLDCLQGLASDGFVSPPAIEPNRDMRSLWNSSQPQSENETVPVARACCFGSVIA